MGAATAPLGQLEPSKERLHDETYQTTRITPGIEPINRQMRTSVSVEQAKR